MKVEFQFEWEEAKKLIIGPETQRYFLPIEERQHLPMVGDLVSFPPESVPEDCVRDITEKMWVVCVRMWEGDTVYILLRPKETR